MQCSPRRIETPACTKLVQLKAWWFVTPKILVSVLYLMALFLPYIQHLSIDQTNQSDDLWIPDPYNNWHSQNGRLSHSGYLLGLVYSREYSSAAVHVRSPHQKFVFISLSSISRIIVSNKYTIHCWNFVHWSTGPNGQIVGADLHERSASKSPWQPLSVKELERMISIYSFASNGHNTDGLGYRSL